MHGTGRPPHLLLALLLAVIALLSPSQAEALSVQSQTFQMSGADAKTRLTVSCPGRTLPYSGGMQTDPVGQEGEGIYPHSYERLGVQHGWHVTGVLYAPSPERVTPRSVTLQVVCGPRLGPVSSPHSTVFVGPGQSLTAVATCPGGSRIFAGGFQRTNFTSDGGAFVTESRAVSDRSWQVSGGASGSFGGELTAIAYCLRSRTPLVSEVSADAPLPQLQSATATTPACPPGSTLVAGGFSTSPSGPALISSAYLNSDGGWSAVAFNRFGPGATLSARGYCMSAATIKRLQHGRHGKRARKDRIVQAPPVLDSALKAAISERISHNGCYPSPADLAATLSSQGIQAQTTGGPRQVRRRGIVYVLSDLASCDRVRLAVRQHDAVILLDSATGEVRRVS
jgi:hypothetical protein